ncbi:MAG: peptidoglycan editing factor PgeF [Pseudomonadota bacterium]
MNEPNPVQSNSLKHETISHGFYTRDGGTSDGIFRGLNVGLGSGDKRENVLENRRRVEKHSGVTSGYLTTLYQVHSPDVVTVTKPIGNDDRPQADGIVTATPGLALGILTADCGPVLFADPENRVTGACHAGWKGATGGVLENTIASMEALGARRDTITAVLGPTISSKNYEVGPEFVERLIKLASTNDAFLSPSENAGHAMFDLPGYIVQRLENSGVNAEWTGHCTYEDENKFFSYRRKTHRGEADYGRQVSVISIVEE